jgi:hypothetical protein
MPDPESLCKTCDQICITPFNPDDECFGRMSMDERNAFYAFLVDSQLPGQPTQPIVETQS